MSWSLTSVSMQSAHRTKLTHVLTASWRPLPASEASKLGIVSRCFIHQMPSYVDESDAVRVFVVFSGLVGAWKAVKSFDNRFFGGRTVRAKFYSEEAVQQGALHL